MRLDLVISTYDSIGNPYYSGGGAAAIHEVAKRLISDFRVTIIAGNYPEAKEHFLDGVHYRYIGSKFFGPKLDQLFYHLCLPFYVTSTRHDIWVENFTPPFSTSFLPLFTRKPIIGLVHMLAGDDMKRKFGIPFDKVERLGLKLYKHFIVLSKNDRNRIKKVNPRAKILLTKNGIDIPNKLLPYPKRSKKHLLFIGRIEVDQKGLDTLIYAYNLVKDKVNLPLVIAGSGEAQEVEKLEKIIRSHNLQDKVSTIGRVTGPKKDWYLRHASIVVIPSRYETFSITALEAISYNIPLICGDIPGMRWIPKGDALKFTPSSSDCLAHKIVELSFNPYLQNTLISSQALTAKEFDWSKIAISYSKYLKIASR